MGLGAQSYHQLRPQDEHSSQSNERGCPIPLSWLSSRHVSYIPAVAVDTNHYILQDIWCRAFRYRSRILADGERVSRFNEYLYATKKIFLPSISFLSSETMAEPGDVGR